MMYMVFFALKAGYSVTFDKTDKMFNVLKLSTIDVSHVRALRYYQKYDLLVVDDLL